MNKPKKRPSVFKGPFFDWIKAFFIAFVLLVLMGFFVFDIKSYSGSGMQKTLLPGDIVWVNKYNYGARMPMRILPQKWVNLLFSTDSLPPVRHLPYWRFPGNNNPQLNDLVLLNVPAPHIRAIDKRSTDIKRLTGMAGDTLLIKNTAVFVNGNPIDEPAELLFNFLVKSGNSTSIEQFIEEFGSREGSRVVGKNTFVFPFSRNKAVSVLERSYIQSIDFFPQDREEIFPEVYGERAKEWDSDNFGPLVIPYKGFTMALDINSLDDWFYHIIYHERRSVTLRNDSIFIDGNYADEFTFQNNYYFFLGDNRHNTSDSRWWGLVPENHIIGKVTTIFLSFDKEANFLDKIRWTRFFQNINKIYPDQ